MFRARSLPSGAMTPGLRASVLDCVFFFIMFGLGEVYLGAYAIHLGADAVQVGLLATIPLLVGALTQLLGDRLVAKVASRRLLIVYAVVVQALALVPIAFLSFLPLSINTQILALIAATSLFTGAGFLAASPWISLFGDMVPENIRGRFGGYRNQLGVLALLLSMISSGIILHIFEQGQEASLAFLGLFLLACIARLVSAYWLLQYDEIPHTRCAKPRMGFREFIQVGENRNFWQFVCYNSIMHFGAFLMAPYIAVYVLSVLEWNYLQFMIMISSGQVAQLLCVQFAGNLADRFGNKKILALSSIMLVACPALWVVLTNFWAVVFTVQILGGIGWGAFNLASQNYLYDSVPPQLRSQASAYWGVFRNLAIVIASGTSALLLWLIETYQIEFSVHPLVAIFVLSTVVRASVALRYLSRFEETREVEEISHSALLFQFSPHRLLGRIRVNSRQFFPDKLRLVRRRA